MSRPNMAGPISVLVAGVAAIVLLLLGAGPRTWATPRAQTDYPAQTAAAQTATASAYPNPGSTEQLTGTATLTETPGTATPSPTGTIGVTRTAQPGAQTPAATGAAAPTAAPSLEPPTETPTATPANELSCAPGVPIEIAGRGPARAAYLIYFDERAVGGGSVEQDGTFVAKLVVGQERAGAYDVTVRVRGTQQVLRQVTCSVPETTPTPLPVLGLRGLR